MKVYLVQHAKALSKDRDPDRPLSPEGRAEARKMARFIGKLAIDVDQLRHSGKTRARQTAEIYAEAVAAGGEPIAWNGLAPNDDPAPLADEMTAESVDVMIVGHMPFLGRLAALLLAGRQSPAIVAFQNAGVVCLERTTETPWQLLWALTPDLLAE